MTAVTIRPDALPAWNALGGTLTHLRAEGRSAPCVVDPAPFISDKVTERREAAAACAGCPALTACRRFADAQGETWHVWAGVDRTPTTRADRKAVT